MYGYMCGSNGYDVNENELQAGCARFGLDNPVPIITRRLALYGNEEGIEKAMEKGINQLKEVGVDPLQFVGNVLDKGAFAKPGTEEATQVRDKPICVHGMKSPF